ncbi:MAG: PEGA domain-containing protein, partial [Myxococcota bacterium]
KRKESPVRKKRTPAKRKTAESKTSNKERTAPLAPEPKSTVRASEADASRSSSARGLLELQTEPSGLVVRKDGKKLGTTPLSVAMNPGSHTLLLRSRRRGVSREVTVNIEQGKTAQIKVELQYGVFKVLSRPWAEVFLDGKPLGKTPLTVDAYEGKHQLKLVSPDGDERTQTIIVEPGDNPIVRVLF